ncbi:MAG TPA: adenylyl-sulfate kinase [Candidatus Nanoarchaeia archaeon]|nr:adenylyl-sulfate kinase [Candidatus Nanoarchaeia archaeon]
MATVIWFTGLSGSGKTTIATQLKKFLEAQGKRVDMIDGDIVRTTLHRHLGFSRSDIRENNRLIATLAKERLPHFDFILVPIISPYQEDRMLAKEILQDSFVELYVNSSLKKCMERDVKGLYKKALKGEIKDYIGIHQPYESPENPDLMLDTEFHDIDPAVSQLISFLKQRNLL